MHWVDANGALDGSLQSAYPGGFDSIADIAQRALDDPQGSLRHSHGELGAACTGPGIAGAGLSSLPLGSSLVSWGAPLASAMVSISPEEMQKVFDFSPHLLPPPPATAATPSLFHPSDPPPPYSPQDPPYSPIIPAPQPPMSPAFLAPAPPLQLAPAPALTLAPALSPLPTTHHLQHQPPPVFPVRPSADSGGAWQHDPRHHHHQPPAWQHQQPLRQRTLGGRDAGSSTQVTQAPAGLGNSSSGGIAAMFAATSPSRPQTHRPPASAAASHGVVTQRLQTPPSPQHAGNYTPRAGAPQWAQQQHYQQQQQQQQQHYQQQERLQQSRQLYSESDGGASQLAAGTLVSAVVEAAGAAPAPTTSQAHSLSHSNGNNPAHSGTGKPTHSRESGMTYPRVTPCVGGAAGGRGPRADDDTCCSADGDTAGTAANPARGTGHAGALYQAAQSPAPAASHQLSLTATSAGVGGAHPAATSPSAAMFMNLAAVGLPPAAPPSPGHPPASEPPANGFLDVTLAALHDLNITQPPAPPSGGGPGPHAGPAAALPAGRGVRTEGERRAGLSSAAGDFLARTDAVLRDFLAAQGYAPFTVEAIIQGDLAGLPDAARILLGELLASKTNLLTSYIRRINSTAAAGRARGGDPATAGEDGANAPATRTLSTNVAMLTHLQLDLGSAGLLVDQFEQMLKTHACQIWAKCNVIDPRPTREIKTSLAAYTGKTTKQVTDWFTNWRARHWRPHIMGLQLGPGPEGEVAEGQQADGEGGRNAED